MKDRANLICFLVGLILSLSVLAIAGVALGAPPETAKGHHSTFQDGKMLAAVKAAEYRAPDLSEWFGTGLLVLVVCLAALWVAKAWKESTLIRVPVAPGQSLE